MFVVEDSSGHADKHYAQSLAGEGGYWDNFIANRLLKHDEIPGSVDFRIFFTQFSYKHNWGPPCLGPIAINFREREIRYIIKQATQRPRMKVLDLGCGAGWLSLELARQGAHVTAVDISPTNLALGRYMVETNARNFPFLYQKFAGLPCKLEDFGSVEYVYGDLNTINLPISEYDAVVVWDSLHHVRDLERLLEQVRHALRPDGVFVGVDHAFASPLTVAFNQTIVPWLRDINSWITNANPEWLYDSFNALARRRDWGVLAVDYDVAPLPGFEAFEAQVRNEMLDIIRSGPQQEALGKALTDATPQEAPAAEEVSPFEDVSAERLMRALIEAFESRHFRTICPLIMPEQHFPPPRSEPERIFQHHLSATLVEISERAVERGQADGQWFLFHFTPERPKQNIRVPELLRIKASRSAESVIGDLQTQLADRSAHVADLETQVAGQNKALEEMRAYTTLIESELALKDAAITSLLERLLQREAELIEARAPRLPWKRRPTSS